MCDQLFMGHRNRETWAVSLHVTNDEGLLALAKEAMRGVEPEWQGENLGFYIEETLEEALEAVESEPLRLLLSDLVGTALTRVDWDGIAECLSE